MELSTTAGLIPAIPRNCFPLSMIKQEQAGEQPERAGRRIEKRLRKTPCLHVPELKLYTGDRSHFMNDSRGKFYCPLHMEPLYYVPRYN